MSYATFNPFSLFVAAVLAATLTWAWHGPLRARLAGASGRADDAAHQAPEHAVAFLAALLTAAAAEVLADYLVLDSLLQALKLALLTFVGLVAPAGLVAARHGGRSLARWAFDAGCQALCLLVICLTVVLWA